jgi:hypothetical protein
VGYIYMFNQYRAFVDADIRCQAAHKYLSFCLNSIARNLFAGSILGIAHTQSDQKLKNPSRVLRLAGCWHIKPGSDPVRCDIIHQSDRIYSYEELRAAIPQQQQPEVNLRTYQPSISDDIPLYQFLTKSDRILIDQGVGQGSRNDSAAGIGDHAISECVSPFVPR